MKKDFSQVINAGYVIIFFAAGHDKEKDDDHVKGSFRGSAHWSCNINLKLI